jgi:hypothetical protein
MLRLNASSLNQLPTWGNHAVTLPFSFATIQIEGLSESQAREIHANHALQEGARSRTPDAPLRFVCHARRLSERPAISAARLTADGLYSPLVDDLPSGLVLRGVNFAAHIPRPATKAGCELAVFSERELPLRNVLENFMRVLMADAALEQGGLLLHSAGLVIKGKAYLFSARSGVGKTTLSRKAFESGIEVLSDDINLLLPTPGGGFEAYCVPFSGEFRQTLAGGPDGRYPLGSMLLLGRSGGLSMEPADASSAVAHLAANAPFVNTREDRLDMLLQTLSRLVACVRVARLSVTRKDPIDAIIRLLPGVNANA